MEFVRTAFGSQGARAAVWAVMGALGLAFAAVGVALMTNGGGSGSNPARVQAASTAVSSTANGGAGGAAPAPSQNAGVLPSASATATVAASATPTESPVPSPTATPRVVTTTSQGQNQATPVPPTPEPEPTAAPTSPPVVAAPGGPYCDTRSASSPPTARVAGALVLGGQPAPAGTTVSLAFDGVTGPSRATTAAGEYRVDFNTGGAECANRVGAAISVVVNGAVYDTGHTIGDGALLIALSISN